MINVKLIFGADHNGVELKNKLMDILKSDYEVIDVGLENYPTDDYPDFAFKTSRLVLENEGAYGVLICGTGVGMCIAANKVKGIRCALVTSKRVAELARSDDDTNMIALDSIMSIDEIVECIKVFTSTELKSDEKYCRRIKKILDYENGAYNEL